MRFACLVHVPGARSYIKLRLVLMYKNVLPKKKQASRKLTVELLVSLMSEHRDLYDKRHSSYKNVDNRDLLWQGIANRIGLDSEFHRRFITVSSPIACVLPSSHPADLYKL